MQENWVKAYKSDTTNTNRMQLQNKSARKGTSRSNQIIWGTSRLPRGLDPHYSPPRGQLLPSLVTSINFDGDEDDCDDVVRTDIYDASTIYHDQYPPWCEEDTAMRTTSWNLIPGAHNACRPIIVDCTTQLMQRKIRTKFQYCLQTGGRPLRKIPKKIHLAFGTFYLLEIFSTFDIPWPDTKPNIK